MNTIYWILRLTLGILITGAGLGKLLNVPGFVAIIGTYQLHLSPTGNWLAAIGVIAFELIVGWLILSGYHLKAAAFGSILMHAGYFTLLTSSLLRGLVLKNCGCFGVFFARPLTWRSPLEDLAMIAISYWLFIIVK